MTFPTNGSVTGPPLRSRSGPQRGPTSRSARDALAYTDRSLRSRGGQLHVGVRADLIGGELGLGDGLVVIDANDLDVATGERRVGVAAQHLTFPAGADALFLACADRDDRRVALHAVREHAGFDRIRLRVIAVRIVRIGIRDVLALREVLQPARLHAAIGWLRARHRGVTRLDVDVRRIGALAFAWWPVRRRAEC